MSDIEAVKSRVRKLPALSKSDNENEAAIALRKANGLIAGYGLDGAALRFESAKAQATKRHSRWRAVIANAVRYLYCCYVYKDSGGAYVFTGEPLYVFMAGEMYSYPVKTVERTAKKSVRRNAKHAYRESFKNGMERIFDRVYALEEACSWAPRRSSMLREATSHVEKTVPLEDTKIKRPPANKKAFNRGASAADGVSLARQTGYSGRPVPAVARGNCQGKLFRGGEASPHAPAACGVLRYPLYGGPAPVTPPRFLSNNVDHHKNLRRNKWMKTNRPNLP